MIVIFRRSIIIICILLLIVTGVHSLPEGKYYDPKVKSLVQQGKAQVVEVNKSFMVGQDTMDIKRIILTEDKTYIRYQLFRKESGWSFPDSSIKLVDEKGRIYQCTGGWSGKPWGQDGLLQTERLDPGSKNIAIKYAWFDRQNQIKVSIGDGGDAHEK